MRMKYYESLRKKAGKVIATENRRRASVIQEEDGENTPLLRSGGNRHSINNAPQGFLVSSKFFLLLS